MWKVQQKQNAAVRGCDIPCKKTAPPQAKNFDELIVALTGNLMAPSSPSLGWHDLGSLPASHAQPQLSRRI